MIAFVIKNAVAIIGALWLGIAGFAAAEFWERRPAGQPSINVLFFKWTAPDSLAVQRDEARADLKACHDNVDTLDKALARQNAETARISADGQRRLAASAKALERAQTGTATAKKRAGVLLYTPPVGIDQCQRWEGAHEAVRKSLEGLR